MSKLVSVVRRHAACVVLGAVALVAVGVFAPVSAARAAQEVSAEVFEKLKPAQDALKARDFDGALKNAKAALGVAKTPYEREIALKIQLSAAHSLRRWPDVIEAGEALMKSPGIGGPERTNLQRMLGTVYVQTRQYDKAIENMRGAMQASGGGTAQDHLVMYSIYVARNDCVNSLASLDRALAGKPADEKQLAWRLNCAVRAKDLKRVEIAEDLVRRFPKKDYFGYLASQYAEQKLDARAMLNVWRFGFERNLLSSEDQYLAYAQTAVDAGFAIEAQRAMESGIKAGIVKKGDAANRAGRLLASSTGLAVEERKRLPQADKEARAGKNGEADFAVGASFFGLGEHAKAAEALGRALQPERSARIRRADDANMLHGISLLELKKRAEAEAAFNAAKADPRMAKAAALWLGTR
jgi:hypothetical protein